MDQIIGLKKEDRRRAVKSLGQYLAASVDAARFNEAPFGHLVFDRVFPDDVYAAMLATMPRDIEHNLASQRTTASFPEEMLWTAHLPSPIR